MRTRVGVIASAVLLSLLLIYMPTVEGGYGDIVFTRKSHAEDDIPPATFPHWVHRINFKCYVCHDAIFHMKAGADPVTMDDVRYGKYCGVCHNGTRAFDTGFDNCQRCHK